MKLRVRLFLSGLTLSCLLIVACDLDRTNPLDPKNPDSYRSMPIVAEVFVNDDIAIQNEYCDYALTAIENLSDSYTREQLMIVEYHLPYQTKPDNDPNISDNFIPLYESYAPVPDERGLPDIFLNGTSQRIQGASSLPTVQERLKASLASESGKKSYLTIEASLSQSGSNYSISGKIARLGKDDLANAEITAVLIEDLSRENAHFVARFLFSSQTITNLKHSESLDFTLTSSGSTSLTGEDVGAIVYVRSIQNKQIAGAVHLK
ncbi:hypothetical protein JXJ21_26350 [candidate division KSB1 bacterium]|nr:hypothetical protein [candidate division KSB1 bacterium]